MSTRHVINNIKVNIEFELNSSVFLFLFPFLFRVIWRSFRVNLNSRFNGHFSEFIHFQMNAFVVKNWFSISKSYSFTLFEILGMFISQFEQNTSGIVSNLSGSNLDFISFWRLSFLEIDFSNDTVNIVTVDVWSNFI